MLNYKFWLICLKISCLKKNLRFSQNFRFCAKVIPLHAQKFGHFEETLIINHTYHSYIISTHFLWLTVWMINNKLPGQGSAIFLGSNRILLGSWPHSPPPPSTKGLIHLSIYLFIHLSFCLSIHLSIYLSIYPSLFLFVCQSIHMYPLLYLSFCLSIIYLSIFIHYSIYLSAYPSSIYLCLSIWNLMLNLKISKLIFFLSSILHPNFWLKIFQLFPYSVSKITNFFSIN